MQSIEKVFSATEIVHFDEDLLDLNLGLLPLNLQMAWIQYHPKC